MMRRPWRVLLVLAVLLIAALGHTAPPQPSSPADRALKLVQAYNGRSFGNPGWRRVHLDLKSGATVTRSFTVTNVWRKEGSIVRMLFVLDLPEGLRGTNYLLVEKPDDPAGMEVFLHLPAGRRGVLSIQPSHFDEGLLGSDFGYRDLRMTIPTAGYRFRLLDRHRLLGRTARAVEAVPVDAATRAGASWTRSVYYLAEDDPVLLGADHFAAAAGGQPAKQMRVQGLRRSDGAWTETRIDMVASDGHSSVLTLEDFKASVPDIDATFFVPETLPSVAGRLAGLRLGTPRSQEEKQ
jgi:hypothetical protein